MKPATDDNFTALPIHLISDDYRKGQQAFRRDPLGSPESAPKSDIGRAGFLDAKLAWDEMQSAMIFSAGYSLRVQAG